MKIPSKLICIILVFFSLNTFAFDKGVVVTEHRLASQVGAHILSEGGNAIDAAVAVGYALAVVNPCCGNIGGGGFMVAHFANGKNVFLNFRENAPRKADRTQYIDHEGKVIPDQTTKGYLAVAVPGTVMGLETALKRYGTMTREQVMAPAIALAKNGFVVTPYLANQFSSYTEDFREQPNVAAIFLKEGKPYQAGDTLIQTELAETLIQIAKNGTRAFYSGSIAKAIVDASKAHHGNLSLPDFSRYTVTESKPVSCRYRDYTLFSAGPPSSGGKTLCYMLSKLQPANGREDNLAIVNAMRDGFAKRNESTGSSIRKTQYHELTDTTHYSIVDKDGNAVSVTYTLNGFFGARVIAGKTGFFLNNEMDDFSVKSDVANKFGLVQSKSNLLEAGKQPLSSMTPTIVLKHGKLFLVIGSPGGPRIITTVLLTLLNLFDKNLSLQASADAPRFHYQGIPDTVAMESDALTTNDITLLKQHGYSVTPQHAWGVIEAIIVDKPGHLEGVNDKRRPDGAAVSE